MNSNRGIDPMLSSLVGDSMWNTKIIAEPVASSLEQLTLPGDRMVSPVPDVLLSPESNPPYSDLEFIWGNERKRVTSIKMEEDDTFSSSPCSTEEVDSSEIDTLDMEECDIKSEINSMEDDGHALDNEMLLHDPNDRLYCDSASNTINRFNMSDVSARKYVDSLFSKIAHVPNPNSTHAEKIRFILSLSDCKDYRLDDILNLDKRSSESARVCAKIVQNIPQRYRWECVKPEEIPCCYTIVADCKKLSNRDKPPRPMNAFMIWAQGARRLINELCPKMQNAAISEALGYYWRQKSDLFKKRFEMEKIKLRRFHNVEFPQYKYKPKTKIQKAKEKKELSMSKCKVSKSAVKQEKLEETESNIPRRKSKYGRPRKAKQIFEPEQTAIAKSTTSKCDDMIKSCPTKPAIKDMLTLKILNDRRSKGMTSVNCNDRFQSCMGQLSPLEIENPATSDVFDELRDFETKMGSRDLPAVESGNRFLSSSVYDTPANTPPIDETDHPLSPIQTPSSSSSSSSSSSIASVSSPVPCQPKVDLPIRSSTSTSHMPPGESMPSLKAILSSGTFLTRRGPNLRGDVSSPGSVSSGQVNCHLRSENEEPRMSTDLMLSYVSEVLTSPVCRGKIKDNKDANNNQGNVCDVNNNCTWQYNSCVEINPNAGNDAFQPKSPVNYNPTFLDFSDLDTLSLDLNVPLLSDDVMKSLLNTL